MVERRKLNNDFLDSVIPPENGERWIADTVVQGFGLRLWAGDKGGGISFCVRTTDKSGKSIRRTYDPFDQRVGVRSWNNNFNDYIVVRLGENQIAGIPSRFLLEDARRWARWVIGQAKGNLPSIESEERACEIDEKNFASVKRHLANITLGDAIELITQNRKKFDSKTTYSDQQLNASTKIPVNFLNTPTGDLTRENILSIISDSKVSPGNRNLIRQLLRDALQSVQRLGGPRTMNHYPTYSEYIIHNSDDDFDGFISSLEQRDFDNLFQLLEKEKVSWRQALCIQISFGSYAPLSRIMAAQWINIHEDRLHTALETNLRYRFYFSDRIDGSMCAILIKISALSESKFGNNPFLFPSPGSKNGHIENVDRVWKRILTKLDWEIHSIKAYRKRYQELMYFSNFLLPEKYASDREKVLANLSKIPQLNVHIQRFT